MRTTAVALSLVLLVLQSPPGLGRFLAERGLLSEGNHYNYQNAGSDWAQYFPGCEGGLQSPINIDTSVVETHVRDLTARIVTFGKGDHVKVTNTGHSVLVKWEQSEPPSILLPIVEGRPHGSIDPLDRDHDNAVDNTTDVSDQRFSFANVELQQFHFHISSENAMDGVLYPMEAHIVTKVTGDEVPECGDEGCLVVFAMLYKISDEDNDFLEPFFEAAPGGMGEDSVEEFPAYFAVNFDDMLPDSTGYYTWHGSFTTPPCTEGVLWILFDGFSSVSTRQLTLLQSKMAAVRTECHKKIEEEFGAGELESFDMDDISRMVEECDFVGDLKNNRELQPINGREVSHVNNFVNPS